MSAGQTQFVDVKLDDERILHFVQAHPETTAVATYAIAAMLAYAEQRGRDAKVEELQNEIAEQVRIGVAKETEELRATFRHLGWVEDQLLNLARAHASHEARQAKAAFVKQHSRDRE